MSALLLDRVSHTFRATAALADVSLTVAAGEVVALIGLNGAGKTTALRVLAGRIRPARGQATVLRRDAWRLPPEAASRFGQVIGAPMVYPELTVQENLMAAGRLHGLSRSDAAAEARSAIARFELTPWAAARARTLSSGNKQRLGIATAVTNHVEALVLDEPTSFLDPGGVVLVRDLIRSLAAGGAGVLVSSHHLDEVSRIADRIVVLHAGRVVGHLTPGGRDLEARFFALVLAADRPRVGDRR